MDINFFSDIKNPVFSTADKTAINLTCNILGIGDSLVFTACAGDCEEYGRQLFQNAQNGVYGTVAEYVDPVVSETPGPVQSTRKTVP